ncbi:MAG: hypothetical protein II847_01085 [Ruminobacter sp.]|jgi:hypothetical protein|uniref:cyclic-phosphate processing receiver domain-containing protein n=1 Tax=Ruminobacter sp. TaxID=2774296 RepID=UPI002580526A|nr:cyclic-phosphate processing receiver domain-containing protein [Ruminobacter sp.]MBQ3774707.1 hypothetical protein [Ruminobacter sp.]
MDYIYFINSRDIREYLYNINFHLNGEQKLFLIDKCYRITLDEKIEAFKSLLKENDEKVIIRNPCYWIRKDTSCSKNRLEDEVISLHEFVFSLLKHYQNLTDLLKIKDNKSYYRISYLDLNDSEEYFEIEFSFTDFDSAVSYLKEQYLNEQKITVVKIQKIFFFDANSHQGKTDNTCRQIVAYLNADLKILNIYGSRITDEPYEDYTTDSLMIYLPTPFRCGDILTCSADARYAGYTHGFDPFVMIKTFPDEKLCRGVDCSDICVEAYYLSDEKLTNFLVDNTPHIYDLEYCRQPIENKFRLLKVLSARLQKDDLVDEEGLVRTAMYCEAEATYKEAWNNLYTYPAVKYLLSTSEEQQINTKSNEYRYIKPERLLRFSCKIKIWLDDEREAPEGYCHCHSVNETINKIRQCEKYAVFIEELNLDHDLGDYAGDGGDAIKLLDFLVERETYYKIKIHTANPVGRANMQRMIDRYWRGQN